MRHPQTKNRRRHLPREGGVSGDRIRPRHYVEASGEGSGGSRRHRRRGPRRGVGGVVRWPSRAIRVHILHDPESGCLVRTDPAFAELWASINGIGEGDPRLEILVPRGDGFFVFARAAGGELMGFHPEYMPIGEFSFDDAAPYASRCATAEDEVVMTGERIGR